ncbi:MAG: cytochrome C [Sulfurimonadaceae bacterium]
MKNSLFLLLLSTAIFAEAYTKEDRIKDMQVMAEAMSQIQTGFFYNNNDIVQDGAIKLSDAVRRVEPPLEEKEEKDPMTRYMNDKVKFSHKITKKIDQKTKLIMQRFKDGDTPQAIQAYTKIMKQCMECHTQLRTW